MYNTDLLRSRAPRATSLDVRKSASANYYHLHGETRWTDKIKRYASVCATTSGVCEAALEKVSQDSQKAGRITKIEDAVREEVVCMIELRCATACRHDCVRGALISWALFQMCVFNDATDFPWVLERGDIKENLALLKRNPTSDARTMKNPATVACGLS